MEVRISRRVADTYKRAAKRAFPVEEYAILLGTFNAEDDVYTIKRFYFPIDREKHCTIAQVEPLIEWWTTAKAEADRLKLAPLGDIHSHCIDKDAGDRLIGGTWSLDTICTPSHADLSGSMALTHLVSGIVPIFGICGVRKDKSKLISQLQFWPAQPSIKVTVT